MPKRKRKPTPLEVIREQLQILRDKHKHAVFEEALFMLRDSIDELNAVTGELEDIFDQIESSAP